VEHHGESKVVAYEKLQFDKLFIGDDYFKSSEYELLKQTYPHVEVITIPRTSHVSTTRLIEGMNKRFLEQMEILYMGVGSSVIRRVDNLIIKSIPLGYSEVVGTRTANVYRFPIPVPRNWARVNTPATHPNYPGVNGYREIDGGALWIGKPWYPFDTSRIVYHTSTPFIAPSSPLEEKARPQSIVDLVGYDGGETLAAWVLRSYERNAFRHILHQVAKVIMEELIPEGFVHGDVHCRNVLVGKDQQISLVDFGWCTHGSFRMDEEERKEHEERVRNVFDVRHFQDSLEKLFMEELGLSTLWMIHRNDLFLFAGIYDQKRDPEEQEHQDT
jgi:hypothetical protein